MQFIAIHFILKLNFTSKHLLEAQASFITDQHSNRSGVNNLPQQLLLPYKLVLPLNQ